VGKQKQNPGGWLFKEEPTCYSYSTLVKDGSTNWTGIKNALALKYLRQVKTGNRVLYYHTGKEKAIVGEMRAVSDATNSEEGAAIAVKVEPVRAWNPVTLEQIKKEPFFKDWELVRLPRLSVLPVSAEQWQRLEEMCRSNGAQKSA
jgi:predicted RNA-binding protein with PUA-like domain